MIHLLIQRATIIRALKYIAVLALAVLLLFVIAANFSSVSSRYVCHGALTPMASYGEPAFIRIEKYRWWVGLWTKSDGNVRLEIPNSTYRYFKNTRDVGDMLEIYDADMHLEGVFSNLSRSLTLTTSKGRLSATCKRVDE
jgi:hypothetical protein